MASVTGAAVRVRVVPGIEAVEQRVTGAALRVRRLRVELGGACVLSGVDLQVAAGEWVNVVGPNGAGKTTILRCLLGAVSFEGEVEIAGAAGCRLSRAGRARVLAYVPQTPVIPAGMRVSDYVMLGRTPHLGAFATEKAPDRTVVAEVVQRLGLNDLVHREVRSLSGGERQRVVIARALAQQADVLLLDEPTTALDLGRQQEVLELVDALRRERRLTVLATLHDLTLAARYGDRIVMLAAGRVAASGPPASVLTAANVATHFSADVRIVEDDDGPVIVPIKTARTATPPERGTP